MSSSLRKPCPQGCGARLTRNQVDSHVARYCPANGAPGLQKRRCANPALECTTAFVPTRSNPNQKYCSKECSAEADALRRGRAPKTSAPEPVGTAEELRDAKQMEAVRRQEADARARAEQVLSTLLTGERNYAQWFSLLGVKEAA